MGTMHEALDEVLAHYGVKGMKWGVRKDSGPQVASPSKEGYEKSASPDAKKANKDYATAQLKGTAALSNKDLQGLVNRMNLEQQYSRLSQPQMKKGNAIVQDILKRYGQAELTALMKGKEGPTMRIAKAIKLAKTATKFASVMA